MMSDFAAIWLQSAVGLEQCAAGAAAEEAAHLRSCAAGVQAATCAQVSRPSKEVWQCPSVNNICLPSS
jgi:hypothetical protein